MNSPTFMVDETNNTKLLAAGAGTALAGRFIGRFLNVLGDIFAARILGPAVFGLYAIGLTVFSLVELVVPLGFDVGLMRFGARHLGRDAQALKGVLIQSLAMPLLFSLVLGASFLLAAPWLARQVFDKPDLELVFRILSFAFPLAALLTILGAALRLTQIMKYAVVVQDLGQPLIALLFLGVFYLLSLRLTGVLLATVLSYAVSVLIGLYFLGRIFPLIFDSAVTPRPAPREIWSFSLASSLAAVFSVMLFWVDRLAVGYFLSAEDTGIYQAASQFSVIFAVILGGLSRIATPMFANLIRDGQHSMIEEVFRISTKWGIYFSLPVLLVLMLAPTETLSVVYGPAFGRGATVLVVLLTGQLFNLITGSVGSLLVITGHQNDLVKLSGAALVFSVVLLWIMIPRYGLVGAAAATSTSMAVFFVVSLLIARQKLRVWPYDRRYFKGYAAALVAIVILLLVRGLAGHLAAGLFLAILSAAAVLSFFGPLLALRLDREDLEFVHALRLRLGRYNRESS